MTDPNPAHEPHRHADDAQPDWYGAGAGGESSGTGSSSAGWPDAPAADQAAWAQAPAYAEQDPRSALGHGQGAAPAYGYGQGAPYQPVPNGGTGLSVASLVLGILSIIGGFTLVVPPIVGVVLGHMGLKREPAGRGMAIAGLVMNYLSVALLIAGVVLVMLLVFAGIAATEYSAS